MLIAVLGEKRIPRRLTHPAPSANVRDPPYSAGSAQCRGGLGRFCAAAQTAQGGVADGDIVQRLGRLALLAGQLGKCAATHKRENGALAVR